MEFVATNGRAPKGSGPFMVKFRSGFISGPYKRDQLRWTDEGGSWCIVGVEAVESDLEDKTRPDNGSYR